MGECFLFDRTLLDIARLIDRMFSLVALENCKGGSMRIPVVFADERRGFVKEEELQGLIQQAAIVSFLRSDGEKVQIGTDTVRGMGGRNYRGPERRGNVLFC
jgi:hypothetical protein